MEKFTQFLIESTFETLLAMTSYISIMYFHEAGHYVASKLAGYNNIYFEYTKVFHVNVPCAVSGLKDDLFESYKELRATFALVGGILGGTFPIILYHFSPYSEPLFTLVLCIMYLRGCLTDLKMLFFILSGNYHKLDADNFTQL